MTNVVLTLVLITSMGLTGCKASDSTKPNTQTTVKSDTSSDTGNKNTTDKQGNNTTNEKSAQNTPTKANENKETFYGNWVITRVLAYGFGTYSKEVAESLIGKSLIFSENEANFFGDQASYVNQVAANPIYKKRTVSKDKFITDYHMTFDKLSITADSVTEITVNDSNGFVSNFLIKDQNTLIIIGGGTFFELVRN